MKSLSVSLKEWYVYSLGVLEFLPLLLFPYPPSYPQVFDFVHLRWDCPLSLLVIVYAGLRSDREGCKLSVKRVRIFLSPRLSSGT